MTIAYYLNIGTMLWKYGLYDALFHSMHHLKLQLHTFGYDGNSVMYIPMHRFVFVPKYYFIHLFYNIEDMLERYDITVHKG